MIVADQHRRDCLGLHGHPLLRTPHLDALAREGIDFRQAYTSSPICVPARNSLLHGCWPCRHLSIANADTEAPRPAPADLPFHSPRSIRKARLQAMCHKCESPLSASHISPMRNAFQCR